MPREWRSVARLTAWLSNSANADSRLRTDIAWAFVDRAPIDWAALLERVSDPGVRSSIEQLRSLDRLRGPAARAGRTIETLPRTFPLVRILVALASLQTAFGLGGAVVALVNGHSVTHLVPPLLPAVTFALASVLLGAISPRDGRAVLLLVSFLLAASAFARVTLAAMPGMWPGPPAWLFRGLFPESFAPAALWHFAIVFPYARRFAAVDLFARRAAGAAWLLGALLFLSNLAIAYGVADHWVPERLGRDHPGNYFWHLFALATLPAVLTILVRARRAPRAERRKAGRFASAIAAGTAPFLTIGLARLLHPGINDWMLSAGPARLWLDVLVVGGLASMPVLTTLAVVIDRPFGVEILWRRVLRGWFAAAWAALAAAVRRRPFRQAPHQARLTAALERVRMARGAREIAVILEEEIVSGAGAAAVNVVDPSELPAESALVPALSESTAVLDFSSEGPLLALMPGPDRDWLEANAVALAAPLRYRDGTTAAIVTLEARRDGRPFDDRDRWFIYTLITAAAAASDGLGAGPLSSTDVDEPAFECPSCGRISASPPLPCGCGGSPVVAALPARLGPNFDVLRRLGSGGMGVVYLGHDRELDRPVALKTLPELRDRTVARLRCEARAMAALNHEALATIYGMELWRRTPVLVVEYFPDGTLADRLARGLMPIGEAVALGIRLADALTCMHGLGVVHRDIKPGNIGLTASGLPKLLDFGLAIDHEPFAGTPAYLPPEALAGAAPDAAVDLWALATVLLEACGGWSALPAALRPFFERALAPQPALRFQSSGEMRAALETLAADLQGAPAPPAPDSS